MSDRVKIKSKLDPEGLQAAAERAFENGEYESAVELFSKAIGIEGLADEICFQLQVGQTVRQAVQIESEMVDRRALVELSAGMNDRNYHPSFVISPHRSVAG
jgi:hypothetical protein